MISISPHKVCANVKRDDQTVRVARTTTEEVNEYEEDIERAVGIYAPHLGAGHVRITRSSEWRIVPKAVAVEPLTLKSGIAAPRSPVNNCGKLNAKNIQVMVPTPSELAAAVLNLIDGGVIAWDDPEVMTVLRGALKYDGLNIMRQQRSGGLEGPYQIIADG